MQKLRAIDFFNTVIVLGASLLLSVLPFVILMSTLASHRIDGDLTRHVGLSRQGAHILAQLFRTSARHPIAAFVSGLVVAVAGCIGVAGSLEGIYERVFSKSRRGIRDLPRYLIWVVVLFGTLAADSAIASALSTVGGHTVLDGLINFGGVVVFFLWSMSFLLAGRVPWRVLLPSALATGLAWTLLELVDLVYFAPSVVSDSKTYGAIGVVFTLATWFIAISAAIVVGAIAGASWRERRVPGRRFRRHRPAG